MQNCKAKLENDRREACHHGRSCYGHERVEPTSSLDEMLSRLLKPQDQASRALSTAAIYDYVRVLISHISIDFKLRHPNGFTNLTDGELAFLLVVMSHFDDFA
jgi:hypothetical protein